MSDYFTPPATIVNGTIAKAADVNNLNSATEVAFDKAQVEIELVTSAAAQSATDAATSADEAADSATAAAASAAQIDFQEIDWIVKTTTYTAVATDYILADLTGGSFTITLPAAPAEGDRVSVCDAEKLLSTSVILTIGRNGKNIQGLAEDMTIGYKWKGITISLFYFVAQGGWVIITGR